MAVSLPAPLFYDDTIKLLAESENTILQRLYDRDETLLTELLALQAIRADLFGEFERLDDLEERLEGLNRVIDAILAAFFQDLDEDGDFTNNQDFFVDLIKDLKTNIDAVESLTSKIVRFEDINSLLQPQIARIDQLEDLDRLIQTKISYIYGKWDINPSDDILSI